MFQIYLDFCGLRLVFHIYVYLFDAHESFILISDNSILRDLYLCFGDLGKASFPHSPSLPGCLGRWAAASNYRWVLGDLVAREFKCQQENSSHVQIGAAVSENGKLFERPSDPYAFLRIAWHDPLGLRTLHRAWTNGDRHILRHWISERPSDSIRTHN